MAALQDEAANNAAENDDNADRNTHLLKTHLYQLPESSVAAARRRNGMPGRQNIAEEGRGERHTGRSFVLTKTGVEIAFVFMRMCSTLLGRPALFGPLH
jgi:hypothetical protein